jgi:hypothetical protein
VKRAFRLAVEGDKYHRRMPKIPMLQERYVRSGFFDDDIFAAVLSKLPADLRPSSGLPYVSERPSDYWKWPSLPQGCLRY